MLFEEMLRHDVAVGLYNLPQLFVGEQLDGGTLLGTARLDPSGGLLGASAQRALAIEFHEPSPGIEPESAAYKAVALPLSYGGRGRIAVTTLHGAKGVCTTYALVRS